MQKITASNLDVFLESNPNMILDFWASWCAPCKSLEPILAEIESEDNISIGAVDVDENPELAERFRVNALPTILVFKDSKQITQLVGLRSKSEIRESLKLE